MAKRKQEETSWEDSADILPIPDLDSSFFRIDEDDGSGGDILEIPEDILMELETLPPKERESRLSVLRVEAAERRKSVQEQESVEPFLRGRVAAALRLFTGTSVPKEFNTPWSATKYYKSAPAARPERTYADPIEEANEDIDGDAIDVRGPLFFDAHERDSQPPQEEDDVLADDDPASHSVAHAEEAAVLVAEEEAAQDELEKSAWLADIEEIKVVSTPAKLSGMERAGDWSVVSQKMSLSCTLTPVVPGRRSCITIEPVMVQLGSKNDEDQYEVTDKDTDSENELTPNSRAKKHIPPWCANWRQKAIAQIAVDPESIFGISMPKCELDVIFTERNYQRMGLKRPKRVRGSSGNWTFDQLTQGEIDRYRAKCGQVVKADGVFVE